MRKIIVPLIVLIMLLAVTVTAAAMNVVDWLTPRLERIVESVETATGWDCQQRIVDMDDLLVVGIVCEK